MPPKKKDEPEKHHGSVYLGGLYDGDKLLAIFFYHQDLFIINEMSSRHKNQGRSSKDQRKFNSEIEASGKIMVKERQVLKLKEELATVKKEASSRVSKSKYEHEVDKCKEAVKKYKLLELTNSELKKECLMIEEKSTNCETRYNLLKEA